jgi:hypothetical protein
MVFVIALGFLLAAGQSDTVVRPNAGGGSDLYSAIPAQERGAFHVAMDKLIALEKRGSWGEVYDLIDQKDLIDGKKTQSREEFVRYMDGQRLLAFVPTSIVYIDREWNVEGCAAFSLKLPPFARSHSSGILCDFTARLTANGWRFTGPPAIIATDMAPPRDTIGCTTGRP